MAAAVTGLVNVLESYRGRDRVGPAAICLRKPHRLRVGGGSGTSTKLPAVYISGVRVVTPQNMRTLCYSCQLLGGVMMQKNGMKQDWGKSLLIVATQLSHCRTVLRLFDDLAMMAYSTKYGLGKKEEDWLIRCISVIGNLSDQLYYPCEHLAWAADAGVIHVKSEKWWTASTALWGLSLFLGILRSIRILNKLRRHRQKHTENDLPKTRGEIKSQIRSEVLTIIGCASDLVNAIHWMPPGFLWGGCFPTWLVGLMGTISSFIGIYQTAVGGNAGGV